MATFDEEFEVLDALVKEWYDEIKEVTAEADGIFSVKAVMYDRTQPVWERMEWPHGFEHEIVKKANRVKMLLTQLTKGFDAVNWDEVQEELEDIMNYARMLAALNRMMKKRHCHEK